MTGDIENEKAERFSLLHQPFYSFHFFLVRLKINIYCVVLDVVAFWL